MKERSKLQFVKENSQLAYGLVLIIIIPLAVIFNTIILTKIFQEMIDRELYNKAITVGEVINANIEKKLADPIALQENLDAMAKMNNEISVATILYNQGNNFKVIASTDRRQVGKVNEDLENTIAWAQNQPIAYLTAILEDATGDVFRVPSGRYWAVVMPLLDSKGTKQGILSLKVSLNVMDEMTKQVLWQSYLILGIIILVIILLLANNTKIFNYVNLYKKLKEVDEMKDDFISIASHELRAPITGIRGYASMMLEGTYGELPKTFKEPLETIGVAAGRLSNLVEDLLNVSRLEQGRMQFILKPTDVNALIKESIQELSSSAIEKNLELIYKPASEVLPEIEIDQDRFSEVITNILSNAIKYTKTGSVAVMTEEKNNLLIIRVKDTGIGMSAPERERLFEKFYRVKNDETTNIVGTGLGLWITKSIVNAMKGQIGVDSMEGAGTQVTISFPVVKKLK